MLDLTKYVQRYYLNRIKNENISSNYTQRGNHLQKYISPAVKPSKIALRFFLKSMMLILSNRNFRTYYFFVYAIILLVMVYAPFKAIAQQNLIPYQDYVPGEIIVKFKPTLEILNVLQPVAEKPRNPQKRTSLVKSEKTALLRIASLDALQRQFGSFQIETIVPLPRFIRSPTGQRLNSKTLNLAELSTLVKLTFAKEIDLNKILAAIESNSNVVYAEPNYIYRIDDIFPGDSKFSEQWGLNNTGQTGGSKDADIDAPEAWKIQKGNSNVIVAIVDTGIDFNHPDLKKNIWTNNGEIANNGIDDDGNGYIDDINGWDFVNDDNDPFDDHGHGTHVAGIVGAVGDNNIGIAGISWYGRLMALKSIGESGHGDVKAVEAIYYGTNNGVRILNNSWGGRLLFANSPRCH